MRPVRSARIGRGGGRMNDDRLAALRKRRQAYLESIAEAAEQIKQIERRGWGLKMPPLFASMYKFVHYRANELKINKEDIYGNTTSKRG